MKLMTDWCCAANDSIGASAAARRTLAGVQSRNLGNDRAWYQRLLDDPGLVVLREPTTASRLRDHFQPARRHVRLKRMVKHRHIPFKDREPRLSLAPGEGGIKTTLTLDPTFSAVH